MALLLLWEIDHGTPFPSGSAGGLADTLMGFTRRLMFQVRADDELGQWLVYREMQVPLAPGLPETHHTRWSLRVMAPSTGAPSGWYDTFTERWRAYLATQLPAAQPALAAAISSSSSATPRRAVPRPPPADPATLPKRRRIAPASTTQALQLPVQAATAHAASTAPTQSSEPSRRRPRSPEATTTAAPPKRRQLDLRTFVHVRPPEAPAAAPAPPPPRRPHGRATEGPPT
jgi:hypothetical protein